jgi:excisionase family DNA binding protein
MLTLVIDSGFWGHKVSMGILEERWVDGEDVASHLTVTTDFICRGIDRKGFPARKLGRPFRFKLFEVDEWVRQGGDREEPGETPTKKSGGK